MNNQYSPYEQMLLTVLEQMRSEHPGKTVGEVFPNEVSAVIRRQLAECVSRGKTDAELAEAFRIAETEVILRKTKQELYAAEIRKSFAQKLEKYGITPEEGVPQRVLLKVLEEMTAKEREEYFSVFGEIHMVGGPGDGTVLRRKRFPDGSWQFVISDE